MHSTFLLFLFVLIVLVVGAHIRISALTQRKIYGLTEKGEKVACRMTDSFWTPSQSEFIQKNHIDIEV